MRIFGYKLPRIAYWAYTLENESRNKTVATIVLSGVAASRIAILLIVRLVVKT